MSKPYSQPGEKGTDTNQASELFELCKEVYERTGWLVNDRSPEYTSDYLLEKLPASIKQDEEKVFLRGLHPNHSGSAATALYRDMDSGEAYIQVFAKTSLKALLKLVIALDDAGELTGKPNPQ